MSDCVICRWVMVGSLIVRGIWVAEANAGFDYAAG